jgi:hypothetical protein
MPKRKRPSVEPGAFGVVMITGGPHAGKLAFYDDDGDGDNAIVFPHGPPSLSPLVTVRHADLGAATPSEVRWWESTHNSEKVREAAAERIRRRRQKPARARVEKTMEHLRRALPPGIRAELRLSVVDKKNDVHTWLKTEVTLGIVPTAGMTLVVGNERDDCEFVDVTDVQYYIRANKLVVDVSVPEWVDESLGNGKYRRVLQHEFIPHLKAAGFQIDQVFDFGEAKRKKRRPGGKGGAGRRQG